jgi:hypothetical protein
MFINPQEEVYEGMIIGEHSRDNDLEVNPLKGKKLTNIRASGSDEAVRLTPPVKMSLEEAIAYIDDDELVEVTPNAIRLRKRFLDPHERKRQARGGQGRRDRGGETGAARRGQQGPLVPIQERCVLLDREKPVPGMRRKCGNHVAMIGRLWPVHCFGMGAEPGARGKLV